MTCPACTEASRSPNWGIFIAGCRGCCARSIARSKPFFDSRTTGVQTREYRALLDQVGTKVDGAHVTHADVIAAFNIDASVRALASVMQTPIADPALQEQRDPTLDWETSP